MVNTTTKIYSVSTAACFTGDDDLMYSLTLSEGIIVHYVLQSIP